MWMALLGPLPKPDWFGNGARLIYVIVVRFGGAVLANVLLWSGSVLYPDYAAGEAAHGISPLADQGAAGVVMMIEQGFVTLGLFAWLFFRAAPTERRAPGAARPGAGARRAARRGPGRPGGGGRAGRPAPRADRGRTRWHRGMSGHGAWPLRDRLLAWLVTGPVGRLVAFVGTSARPCCAARPLSSAVDEDLGHRARRLPRPRRRGDRGRRRRAPCGAGCAPSWPATCACPAFARARSRRNSSSSGLGATPSSSRRFATRCPSGTSARSWTRGSPPSATRSWTCPRCPDAGEELSFSIEVAVRPKATLGEYRGLEVGRAEVEVPDGRRAGRARPAARGVRQPRPGGSRRRPRATWW